MKSKLFLSDRAICVAIACAALTSALLSGSYLIAQTIPVYKPTDCVWQFSENTSNPCNKDDGSCFKNCQVPAGGCPANITVYAHQDVGNALSGGDQPYRNENQNCTCPFTCKRVEHMETPCLPVQQTGGMYSYVCEETDEYQNCFDCQTDMPGDWSVVVTAVLYNCPEG